MLPSPAPPHAIADPTAPEKREGDVISCCEETGWAMTFK